MSSTVLTPQVPPSWRLTTVGLALLLLSLALWLSALLLDQLGGPRASRTNLTPAWSDSASAPPSLSASPSSSSLQSNGQLPKRATVLITCSLALCTVGVLLALAQRSSTDLVLAGASLLWSIYFGLGTRSLLASVAGDAAEVSTAALQAVLMGALALTIWYALHLLKRTGLSPHPPSVIKALGVGALAAWLLSAAGAVEATTPWILPFACLVASIGTLVRVVDMARRPGSLLRPSVAAWLLAAAISLAVASGTHEVWQRVVAPSNNEARVLAWFTTSWAVLSVLVCVLGLRLDQLARMLRQLGSSHGTWRKRLREVQRQLSQTNERLALRERGETQRLQRDRILREVHDELGHRLLSAVTLTHQIDSSPTQDAALRPQLQRLLDNSLIELRLAYEALEVIPRPLAEALNELRLQLETSLDETQVDLRWVVDTRAAMLVLPTAETLQLLRIVREALSPMIERAALGSGSASTSTLCKVAVDVPDGETGRHLRLRISDEPLSDGPEVAEPLVRLGTSWIKLQRQATALGAQLALDPQAGERHNGWSLELVMSLAGR